MAETKKILAVMSEWGYWGIELVGPLRKLEAAGYSFDFVTPEGQALAGPAAEQRHHLRGSAARRLRDRRQKTPSWSRSSRRPTASTTPRASRLVPRAAVLSAPELPAQP